MISTAIWDVTSVIWLLFTNLLESVSESEGSKGNNLSMRKWQGCNLHACEFVFIFITSSLVLRLRRPQQTTFQ
jgi:hypothetical protein